MKEVLMELDDDDERDEREPVTIGSDDEFEDITYEPERDYENYDSGDDDSSTTTHEFDTLTPAPTPNITPNVAPSATHSTAGGVYPTPSSSQLSPSLSTTTAGGACITPSSSLPPTACGACITPSSSLPPTAGGACITPSSSLPPTAPARPTTSHQPTSSSWSTTLSPVSVAPFTQQVGPTVPISSDPVEVFELFFTPDILALIIDQTKIYAGQVLGEEKYSEWEKITGNELRAYFGFKILMGLYPKPARRDYWRQDPFVRYIPISDRISRDRFCDLDRFLHFANNETLPSRGEPGYDRLGKVREVMDKVNNKFLTVHKPHRENSMDEAMIKFQGHSQLKQYMPAKPVKRGIKVWCRADAHNGYLCEFQVYQGREEGVQGSLGTRVVLALSHSLEGKSYHLYFDNFFTSVSLLSTLLSKGLYACGTTRQSYKEFPPALKMKGKGKAEMQQHGLVNR